MASKTPKNPCEWCGGIIPAKKRSVRFCSSSCSTARGKNRICNYEKVSSATVGAVSELLVSANLLSKGCAVFRALSPTCPFDLIVIHKNYLCRVEVRTGYYGAISAGGYVWWSRGHQGADLFAVVVQSKEPVIYYQPITESGERLRMKLNLTEPKTRGSKCV